MTQLTWRRVMPGEYRADVTDKISYHIDQVWIGCDCSGSMRWVLTCSTGYRQSEKIDDFKVLAQAKKAAHSHYEGVSQNPQ